MHERGWEDIVRPEPPEAPQYPEITHSEQSLFQERPELARLRQELEELLNKERLDHQRLQRWVEVWNQKESEQKGFQGEYCELSNAVSIPCRQGKLRYFLFPATGGVKIGYTLREQR